MSDDPPADPDPDPDRDRCPGATATPPGWMVAVDEALLRVLAAAGPTRLYPLRERVAGWSGSAPPVAYLLLRCRQLRREGFLGYDPGGYYRISAHGRAFLAGGPPADGGDGAGAVGGDDGTGGSDGAGGSDGDEGDDGSHARTDAVDDRAEGEVPVELDLTVEPELNPGRDASGDAEQ